VGEAAPPPAGSSFNERHLEEFLWESRLYFAKKLDVVKKCWVGAESAGGASIPPSGRVNRLFGFGLPPAIF
jgi:hypothetical protein